MTDRRKNHDPEEITEDDLGLSSSGPGDQETDTDEVHDPLVESKIAEWIAQENVEKQTVTATLYKFDDPNSGSEKKQVCKWTGDIPDSHTIGLKFGSGRYMFILTIPPGKKKDRRITSYRFRLHAYYDELRKGELNQELLSGPSPTRSPVPVPMQGNGSDTTAQAFTMLKEVLALFLPLLTRQQTPQPSNGHDLIGAYSMMRQVMKDSLLENQQLLSDMQRKYMRMIPATAEKEEGIEFADEEKPKSMLEQFLPMLEKFVVPLLNKPPMVQQATLSGMQAIPHVSETIKQIAKNKEEVSRFIEYFDKINKGDRKKTDKILAMLKVTRPKTTG